MIFERRDVMNIYRSMYHAKKPEGIENKKAYIISGGIAGLASAVFLIDGAHMPGENITIIEKRKYLGGCCDAYEMKEDMFVPVKENLNQLWNVFGIYVVRYHHLRILRELF